MGVQQVTFKAGLAAKVHRWFRLTPSFGPDLVRHMLEETRCRDEDVILDPFAGAATTLIECQLEGRPCIGFEINPMLGFVGQTCLRWELDPTEVERELAKVLDSAAELRGRVTFETLEDFGLSIPPIYNPTRWWRHDVLCDLLALKKAIDDCSDPHIVDFLRLALAGKLVPDLTNVTLGRLQLHFIDRTSHDIDAFGAFASHAQTMVEDLKAIHDEGLQETSQLMLRDATQADDLGLDGAIGCVLTSPPYPNRYSYVWNTRPHLFFLDFFTTPKQASELDKLTIGGTWGSATSDLARCDVEPSSDAVERVAGPVVQEIRATDNLMANYVMKYFNLLADQIVAMDRMLAKDARVAYVVGCSRIKGTFIETDKLLGALFTALDLGYSQTEVHRIRKRNSGKNLHESIVYGRKG
jgi:hypothetical protein